MFGTIIHPKDARKVIVLGAGASAADGAPLQAGLFPKYAEIFQRNSGFHATGHKRGSHALFKMFHNFWGAKISTDSLDRQRFPTFEEALGLLEMADARGEYFKGFGGGQAEATRAQELRGHLINLIAVVLDDTLKIFSSRSKEHTSE